MVSQFDELTMSRRHFLGAGALLGLGAGGVLTAPSASAAASPLGATGDPLLHQTTMAACPPGPAPIPPASCTRSLAPPKPVHQRSESGYRSRAHRLSYR